MSASVTGITRSFVEQLTILDTEMSVMLRYAESLWTQHAHHFPHTSYGYAMCLFSKIDLFSQYWFPNEGNQTRRMVAFLHIYLGYPEKESEIAVQFWRHKLMHTSQPRELVERSTGRHYRWLLHYQLGRGHWSFQNDGESRVFQMGLFDLSSELRKGLDKAIEGLANQPELVASWEDVTRNLAEFGPKY